MLAHTKLYPMIILLLMVLIKVDPVISHPHVFIAQETTIVFDKKGLSGFKIHWTFDDMFSVMISDDFDADKNGDLDKKEVSTIKEKAFGYIGSYGYYTQIKIEGKPFEVKFVKEFNATLANGKLIYEFFIPCHVQAIKNPKQIVISPYDPEYYSAIYFPDKKNLFFKNTDSFEIESKTERDMSTLIYYDTVNPLAIFLTFRLK